MVRKEVEQQRHGLGMARRQVVVLGGARDNTGGEDKGLAVGSDRAQEDAGGILLVQGVTSLGWRRCWRWSELVVKRGEGRRRLGKVASMLSSTMHVEDKGGDESFGARA